ncbi:MAG: sugar fermentation stimulation protein A [Chlamydiales bacterium]|jgi:sugar fermentation stimulation protein A
MLIDRPIIEGRLLKRYKRFLADIELPGGETLTAHCPNTGTLLGCTPEGARTILRDSQNPARKLRYTFQTIEIDGTWVTVDTSLANEIVAEAIGAGSVPELTGYAGLRREVRYGTGSRIDILLEDDGRPACYVEVKSTTLVRDGHASFPDAVTKRGQKHLVELEGVVQAGGRGVIFFCVSRDDVESFGPADDIDPVYGRMLRHAVANGVEAFAYTTLVQPDRVDLGRSLPIRL